jgi:hypothetical protein
VWLPQLLCTLSWPPGLRPGSRLRYKAFIPISETPGSHLISPTNGTAPAWALSLVSRPFPHAICGDAPVYAYDMPTDTFVLSYKSSARCSSPTLVHLGAPNRTVAPSASTGGARRVTLEPATSGTVVADAADPNLLVITLNGGPSTGTLIRLTVENVRVQERAHDLSAAFDVREVG